MSAGAKRRSGSEWTLAMAPTRRLPMSSGAAITACTVTSAYCGDWPDHSWYLGMMIGSCDCATCPIAPSPSLMRVPVESTPMLWLATTSSSCFASS